MVVASGVSPPSNIPTSISLDITFAGCNFKGYNRRLFGILSVNSAQKYARNFVECYRYGRDYVSQFLTLRVLCGDSQRKVTKYEILFFFWGYYCSQHGPEKWLG